jgi:CheY-like chemotaxis protein
VGEIEIGRRDVSRGTGGLEGLRVFVVEDEAAVLLMVEDMLATLGCEVAVSASQLGSALEAAPTGDFEVAVLDINVGGELVYPVAEALKARRVPMVFSTGYGTSGVEAPWHEWPILQKPYRLEQLADALRRALGAEGDQISGPL